MKSIVSSLAVCLAISFVAPTGAAAEKSEGGFLSGLLGALGGSDREQRAEETIRRAFDLELDRRPTVRETEFYKSYVIDDGWTESDIRKDIRRGGADRAGGGTAKSGTPTFDEATAMVKKAYMDVLGREPDADGLREFRKRILDDGWSIDEVRSDLRKSGEFKKKAVPTEAQADAMIRRAYREVLGRDPDLVGLKEYRVRVIKDGWTEDNLRKDIARSKEFKATGGEDPQVIVRRAYREVFGRDPDPSGLKTFSDLIRSKGWTEERVKKELRNSDEYKRTHKKK